MRETDAALPAASYVRDSRRADLARRAIWERAVDERGHLRARDVSGRAVAQRTRQAAVRDAKRVDLVDPPQEGVADENVGKRTRSWNIRQIRRTTLRQQKELRHRGATDVCRRAIHRARSASVRNAVGKHLLDEP